jgi:2'-5' RNA ligase
MSANIRFVGIALPARLSNDLANLQKRLYEPEAMLKPLVPHITLLHPVSLFYVNHEKLMPKIRKLSEELLPITITLTEFDHFDDQTFHIVVNHVESDLHHLYHEIVSLLPNKVRVRHYSRRFHPHITICQSRTGELHHHSLYEKAAKHFDLSNPLQVTIDEIHLFKLTGPREYSVEKI